MLHFCILHCALVHLVRGTFHVLPLAYCILQFVLRILRFVLCSIPVNSSLRIRPHIEPQDSPPAAECSYIDPLSFVVAAKTKVLGPTPHNLLPYFVISPSFSCENAFSFGELFAVLYGNIKASATGCT